MLNRARHRNPGRATTLLAGFPTAMSARSAAVAVASGGMLMTLTAPGAQAAPAATQVAGQVTTAATTSKATAANTKRSYRRSVAKSAAVKKVAATRQAGAKKTSATAHGVVGARARVLELMRRHQGTPYRYGGTTPAGFDCSGFTQYVYRQAGIKLPRTSAAQRRAGRAVPRSQARPGDLVTMPGHVGIYIGNGMMYDSPRTGKRIGARKIWTSNYRIIRVIRD